MRIASLYLPGFTLQVAVRQRPELAGRAVALLAAPGGHPRDACVVSLSRAALERGVRRGMGAAQARRLAPDLEVVGASAGATERALQILAEELAPLTPALEIAASSESAGVFYLEVPRGARSTRFARRVLATTRAMGYRGRVGVADDRFTARAAAARAQEEPVMVVSRAGAGQFLAPLSIDLLPLPDEVRAMLRAAGVHTIGAFAALPPPSVRPAGVDYHELACGRGPATLRPFRPGRYGARRAPELPLSLSPSPSSYSGGEAGAPVAAR